MSKKTTKAKYTVAYDPANIVPEIAEKFAEEFAANKDMEITLYNTQITDKPFPKGTICLCLGTSGNGRPSNLTPGITARDYATQHGSTFNLRVWCSAGGTSAEVMSQYQLPDSNTNKVISQENLEVLTSRFKSAYIREITPREGNPYQVVHVDFNVPEPTF